MFEGKTVEVSSAEPLSVHVDGHPIGTTPVQFRVLPKALKVVAGVESHSRGGIRKRGPMNAWRYPRQWLSAALLAGLLVMGLGPRFLSISSTRYNRFNKMIRYGLDFGKCCKFVV
jgi:hypothetical protein